MDDQLTHVIEHIAETHRDNIQKGSRNILELDLGDEADRLGFTELGRCLRGVEAVVPVRQPAAGMKVLIDGRTFVNYAEYEPGIAVPGRVAGGISLAAKPFAPQDSFIRVFH